MMMAKNTLAILGLIFVAQLSMAGGPGPLPPSLGTGGLPLDMGGVAAIAAVSLIIGAQLIKRREK
jgi:hypothetical protein